MSNIVETAVKANVKRITYGIELKHGNISLNEWGLHESVAKQVHEQLVRNGDTPFTLGGQKFTAAQLRALADKAGDGTVTIGGLEFSRRAPSELSALLAEMKAEGSEAQA